MLLTIWILLLTTLKKLGNRIENILTILTSAGCYQGIMPTRFHVIAMPAFMSFLIAKSSGSGGKFVFTTCATQASYITVPQFPHLLNGCNNSICSVGYYVHVNTRKTHRIVPRDTHFGYYHYHCVGNKMMMMTHCCTCRKETMNLSILSH